MPKNVEMALNLVNGLGLEVFWSSYLKKNIDWLEETVGRNMNIKGISGSISG